MNSSKPNLYWNSNLGSRREGSSEEYQLRDGLGEEMVMATIGGRGRGGGLKMEVGEDFPIGQGLQEELL